MRVKGKLICVEFVSPYEKAAEIEFAPVDTAKLKIGNEVLVKFKIDKVIDDKIIACDLQGLLHFVKKENIVAHFPAPEPKKVELPDCILENDHNLSPKEEFIAEKIDRIIEYLKQQERKEYDV